MKFYIDDENDIICEYDSKKAKYYSKMVNQVFKLRSHYLDIPYKDYFKLRELTGIEIALYNTQIQKLIEAGDD